MGRDHISWRLGWLTSGLDNQGLTTLPDNQTLVRLLRLGVKLLLLLLRLVKRRADILQRGAIGGLLLLFGVRVCKFRADDGGIGV